LRAYFAGQTWYAPRADYSDVLLSSTDRYNLQLIEAEERHRASKP